MFEVLVLYYFPLLYTSILLPFSRQVFHIYVRFPYVYLNLVTLQIAVHQSQSIYELSFFFNLQSDTKKRLIFIIKNNPKAYSIYIQYM